MHHTKFNKITCVLKQSISPLNHRFVPNTSKDTPFSLPSRFMRQNNFYLAIDSPVHTISKNVSFPKNAHHEKFDKTVDLLIKNSSPFQSSIFVKQNRRYNFLVPP